MTDPLEVLEKPCIAKIEGKTTPFGFNINLFEPIHKNSYLTAKWNDRTYVLGIQQLWNDHHGHHAKVNVIGETPLSPFDLNTEIFRATNEEIISAIGLNIPEENAHY